MTAKVCAKCGTLLGAGKYCPKCGQQLYPDVGETVWDVQNCKVQLCDKPRFDVWNGEVIE